MCVCAREVVNLKCRGAVWADTRQEGREDNARRRVDTVTRDVDTVTRDVDTVLEDQGAPVVRSLADYLDTGSTRVQSSLEERIDRRIGNSC